MTTFIIPSYNSLSTLAKTVESILNQTVQDFELIIVDSSEDPAAKAQALGFASGRVKVISLAQKTIPALGRNIGARQARGELLCFIDSDVILAMDWLENISAAYREGCQAGGGIILIPSSQQDNTLALAQLYLQFNEYLTAVAREPRLFVPSCNMFCGQKLFAEAGGFPSVRASEDTLFFLKLKGVAKIFLVPQAKCYHVFREEKKAFLKNQFLLGRYVSIYRRRYYKSWMYYGWVPVLLSPVFITVKLIRIVARVSKAGPSHRGRLFSSTRYFLLGLLWWSAGFIKGCIDDGNSRG